MSIDWCLRRSCRTHVVGLARVYSMPGFVATVGVSWYAYAISNTGAAARPEIKQCSPHHAVDMHDSQSVGAAPMGCPGRLDCSRRRLDRRSSRWVGSSRAADSRRPGDRRPGWRCSSRASNRRSGGRWPGGRWPGWRRGWRSTAAAICFGNTAKGS